MSHFQSACPNFLEENVFETEFSFDHNKCNELWNKLQLRETFVRGQVPPYRVEFVADSQSGAFKQGELNIHHGPLLSVHGAIGEINSTYRDLKYFYGSYVLSFRLVRPVRLEFFRDQNTIKLKLTSYVKPSFKWAWSLGNRFFWKFFRMLN